MFNRGKKSVWHCEADLRPKSKSLEKKKYFKFKSLISRKHIFPMVKNQMLVKFEISLPKTATKINFSKMK